MSMFKNLGKNSMSKINCSIVHGLNFEAAVCGRLWLLNVCFGNSSKAESSRSFTFESTSRVTEQKPLKELKEGVLYHLRPFHPMIDAVAYVHDKHVRGGDEKEAWLLLIQVSLSSYSCSHMHTSKAKDLLKPPTGCEQSENCLSWIQYYRNCIPVDREEDVNVMYVPYLLD